MADMAVIKTGGKQYIVKPGQKIQVEKLPEQEGSEVVFDEVLLVEKAGKAQVGSPYVKGAKVKGKIEEEGKGKKLVVFKFKSKKRYKVKKGHRQPFTGVEITSIE